MLLKNVIHCAGRRSYSVGKVFVQHIKSQCGGKLLQYFHLNCKCISRKAAIQDLSVSNSLNESFNQCITKNKEKINRKTIPRRKISDEIVDYLKQSCPIEVMNTIPQKCFKRNRMMTDQLYLALPEVADIILHCVKDDILKEGAVILETNPGVGVLSKKLIDAGVQQLHLHEPSPTFNRIVKNFQDLHSDKVFLHTTDFFSLWKIQYQDKMDNGTRIQEILSHYPKKCWVEEPALKIIGCIQTSKFIKHLILSIVFQTGIMMHCRPELYLLVPPTLHQRLTCSGEDGYVRYRSISVLFQILFDYELLEKVPRKAYLPWCLPITPKKRKLDEVATLNEEWLYLMKIVPKQNLHEIIPAEKLPALWYFVRHHLWSRSSKVIRDMESWIPGCGVRLILEGYNIFTEFGDLKPADVLNIFQLFSKWPEYQDCSFLSSLETALLKLEENSSDKLENERSDDEGNEDNEDNR